MNYSGIYCIKSVIKPNRCYIGSAIRLDRRKRQHFSDLKLNKHKNPKLQAHYNKYKDDLIFSVLIGCDEMDLLKIEQYFIDSYKPWFNINQLASSSLGVKRSIETIEKLKRLHPTPYWKGKKLSAEHREKLSRSHKGKVSWNKGKKGTQVAWNKGRKGLHIAWNKGKSTSEETKQKIREARAKQIFSEEAKAKRLESYKRTIENRRRLKVAI